MRDERGFSLMEMLVASLVMALTTAGFLAWFGQSLGFYERHTDNSALRQEARIVLSRMATEFRAAGYEIGNLTDGVTIASSTQLQIVGDIDDSDPTGPCDAAAEGATNGGAERVTYALEGTMLRRTVDCWTGAGWLVGMQDNIMLTKLVAGERLFDYYDASGTSLPTDAGPLTGMIGDVRLIETTLHLIDTEATVIVGEGPPEFNLSRFVRLNNLETIDDT